jgi:hypothetical protein
MLALVGLIALVVAVLTGSTPLAILVVVLAAFGIVLLLRNWRDERGRGGGPESGPPLVEEFGAAAPSTGLTPDEFSPDISGDPDGPSSDARAD